MKIISRVLTEWNNMRNSRRSGLVWQKKGNYVKDCHVSQVFTGNAYETELRERI